MVEAKREVRLLQRFSRMIIVAWTRDQGKEKEGVAKTANVNSREDGHKNSIIREGSWKGKEGWS